MFAPSVAAGPDGVVPSDASASHTVGGALGVPTSRASTLSASAHGFLADAMDTSSLTLAPVADPAAYAARHFNVYAARDVDGQHAMAFAKGTTTLAFKFRGGIIVSVDSRSTQGPYIGACVLGGGGGRAARAPG